MSASAGQPTGKKDQILFGALAALCASVVLQIVDKQPKLDSFLGYALYCFAAGLPILVASFLLEEYRPPEVSKSGFRMLFDLLGILLALAGFILLFFFLNVGSGWIFLAVSIFCSLHVLRSLRS